MKILLTGGGTGGHITPILAVAHELKMLQPTCQTVYVGERGGKFTTLTDGHQSIDAVFSVSAGKFRRYHNESWFKRIIDIKTIVLNIRDFFRLCIGIPQAWRLLGKIKPDVVFLKGGFVGVPIGLAAALRHIPIVTHDSDALPGLANRLVSRWARIHATALPSEYYPYPLSKVKQVGVLVDQTYQAVDAGAQQAFKTSLGIDPKKPMLLITGGSSGAIRLNQAIVKIVVDLLQKYPDLYVIHQVGKGKASVYGQIQHQRLQVLEFLRPMHVYMGAADLVITRAGANTLAELGVQGKAVIAVPSPYLTGGHQLKNTSRLEEQGAVVAIEEEQLADATQGLMAAIQELLNHDSKRHELAERLQSLTTADAANKLARILLSQIPHETVSQN